MRHVFAKPREGYKLEQLEVGCVHFEGVGLIGSATLCGHTDRNEYHWHDTNKRVNCSGCLAVRDHVVGKRRAAIRALAQPAVGRDSWDNNRSGSPTGDRSDGASGK